MNLIFQPNLIPSGTGQSTDNNEMNILDIPFVKTVGINDGGDGKLALELRNQVLNHVNTIHASAQFTLAETASGTALQAEFPGLEQRFIPLLRESSIKFKKPAAQPITAYPEIAPEEKSRFLKQLDAKGRASITVDVVIRDQEGTVTSISTFNWFLQGRPATDNND